MCTVSTPNKFNYLLKHFILIRQQYVHFIDETRVERVDDERVKAGQVGASSCASKDETCWDCSQVMARHGFPGKMLGKKLGVTW